MVSIDSPNAYELREFAKNKVITGINSDSFKSCFVRFLGLDDTPLDHVEFGNLSLYQKCTVSSLQLLDEAVSKSDLIRLLGQAPRIDHTPMPWVSDLIGIMTIKWLVQQHNDAAMEEKYRSWISKFVPQQLSRNRLNDFENDIAQYIQDSTLNNNTATIPLFLHYHGKRTISEQNDLRKLINRFFSEFKEQVTSDISPLFIAMMIYCFDRANRALAVVPPNNWQLEDLSLFLNRIPDGLRRWTWEVQKGRTANSEPVTWSIENEYHVQNLLYVLLAPIFNDIASEINLPPVGQRNPRADLYLPSLHTIIEVKYRKNSTKTFSTLIGEISEDSPLYHADTKYQDASLVCFLWDHARSTQEHTKFKEGVLKIQGVDECIVVCSPSFM